MKYRRDFINDNEVEIKQLQAYNKLDTATIGRFKSDKSLEYKIVELKDKIAKREERINELEEYSTRIKAGEEDENIRIRLENAKKDHIKQHNETMHIKREKKAVSIENKTTGEKVWNSERSDNQKYNYESTYRFYMKTMKYLPQHILDILSKMPNNKGRIYRTTQNPGGIWLFGSRPDDGTVCSVTDRHGDTLIIIEWDHKERRTYHKIGDKKRVLVSCEKRRNIFEL